MMNGYITFFLVIGIYTAIVAVLHRVGIVRRYLFSLELDMVQFLKDGILPDVLRKEFEKNNVPLCENARATLFHENNWEIIDSSSRAVPSGRTRYMVMETEKNLSVYLDRYNISFYGPFLMWRTEKGREYIDRLARHHRTFFTIYGRISVGVCITAMTLMTLLLLWQSILVMQISSDNAPSPVHMVGIPGVNPLIPVWYGIAGLAVAIVVHEFAHGIQARLYDLKIKSLGILWLVVPMGAFVEPDEEKIMVMPSDQRQRMFAVGPATNIFVALICIMIFSWGFMSSIEAKEEGMLIISVTEEEKDGVVAPADEIGLESGMIIVSMNGENISTYEDFTDFLDEKNSGENITLVVYDSSRSKGERYETYRNVTLVDRSAFTELEEDEGKGYLGVGTFSTDEFSGELAHPYANDDNDPVKMLRSTLFIIAMPFFKLTPFPDEITDNYEVTGPLSFLPDSVFWSTANLLYWLFWLNLMVGITNALPAVPLDGGYIFKDRLRSIVQRVRKGISDEKTDEIVAKYSRAVAYLILFLILWQLIGPRLSS